MTIVALKRVNLVNPMGDVGDRLSLAMSTCIANDEWLIEANYHYGTLGDVTLYRNINHAMKGAEPDWRWYAGIPTANIKAYALASPLAPSTLKSVEVEVSEPEAENPSPKASTATIKQ